MERGARGTRLWVDIAGHEVHFFVPATEDGRSIDVGRQVAAVVRRTSGGLVLALSDGFGFLDEDTGEVEIVAPIGEDAPRVCMNDGKCDPEGRFWAGTLTELLEERASALYQLDANLLVATVLEGVTISNGLGWSSDRSRMCYADSPTGGLDVFDYDETNGDVRDRQRLISLPPELGVPDGLMVDAEGHLWVVVYGRFCVCRYSPEGEPNAVVELPVSQVTSCAFGGPRVKPGPP